MFRRMNFRVSATRDLLFMEVTNPRAFLFTLARSHDRSFLTRELFMTRKRRPPFAMRTLCYASLSLARIPLSVTRAKT